MPPSGHHRQRFAHNPLHRPVRRQDTFQASSTSHISQRAQIFPSNADVESQASRNTVVAGATVAIVIVVIILVCSAAFFLVRYRRMRRKAMLQPLPDEWSWMDVGVRPPMEERKPEEQAEMKPQHLSLSGEEPITLLCDVNAQAHSPKTLPRSESPGMDEHYTSPLGSPSKFHLPSFTFTLPSPVTPAPTRESVASSVFDSRRNPLFDEYVNVMMGEGSTDASVPRLDCGRVRRESGESARLNEQSWWSNDSGQSSSGPSTPSEKSPVRNPESPGHGSADPGKSDKPGWELLTKMRRVLPSTPPSLKPSVTSELNSSSIAVRRSFTSPAFFTMVTPPNNSAVSLKPFVPDKRESVTSNYILAFLDGQGKLGLDLLDEALPPPAIMVSPPTVSTLNLCRQSMVSLDKFADTVDPWSIAYGVAPNLNTSSTPVVELSRKKGDPFATRLPRPPKSHRRTYVQQQVEAY